jgi:hypothetical protein
VRNFRLAASLFEGALQIPLSSTVKLVLLLQTSNSVIMILMYETLNVVFYRYFATTDAPVLKQAAATSCS